MMLTYHQLSTCLAITNAALQAKGNDDIDAIWAQLQALCGLDGMLLGLAESSTDGAVTQAMYGSYGEAKSLLDQIDKSDWASNLEVTDSVLQKFASADGKAILVLRGSHPGSCMVTLVGVLIADIEINPTQQYMLETLLPHINVMLSRPGFLTAPKLTARERQILVNVNRGLTHDQVAELIGVTRRTVCFHLSNIYRKYDVNDKVSAVNKARFYGDMLAA